MDMLNSNANETLVPVENLASSVPESVTAPVVSAPEAAPVAITVPAVKATPAVAPAPVPAVRMELPKTTGTTVGGWNRFAGYNPNAAKNKPKDGRGGSGRK